MKQAYRSSSTNAALTTSLLLALTACVGTSPIGAGTDGSGGEAPSSPTKKQADKVDIVVVIDNSRSMIEKQEILSQGISEFIEGLANPPCVSTSGKVVSKPTNQDEACPDGTLRMHMPVDDIHVGILSTSLGGHGADSCPPSETSTCSGAPNSSLDDKGHLLSRVDTCGIATVPTYQDKGFLAWDPKGKLSPAGDADLGEFSSKLTSIMAGVGQIGCGFESQLESWYRFLADPEPYQSLTIQNGQAFPKDIDAVVLKQRKDFLRPDSMLVILLLSDEDDCSIKDYGQFYFAAQVRDPANATIPFHLPRARKVCAINPNDPCCLSCGQMAPAECPPDPTCDASPLLSEAEDHPNLRCWAQKRRFGIDFLYPVDRYVSALSSPMIVDKSGELVPNPIFTDLDPSDENNEIRDPGLVVFAGILGVPWQNIARDPSDPVRGYKNADELSQSGAWDVLLGDPANYVAPKDPLMIQSVEPRIGINPIMGYPISSDVPNPINGQERIITNVNDIQYTCIFPLPTPRDCADPANLIASCDCPGDQNDPLCAPNPKDNNQPTLQVYAKAYPATRSLGVLEGVGAQGVVGSTCPSQLSAPDKPDYGYRPTFDALLERVRPRLKTN